VSIRLDIREIGARGDGVAELDGRRYFVPFTLPGETVDAEPRDKRGEGIAADLLEVLAPSRHREAPPCAHFKVCGGCALQHWRRDAYTAWKVELIVRALAQRGVEARFRAAARRRAGRAAPRRLRAASPGQARGGGLP
jgi:23S rRNA (uracil1939-C5)-methyltransferase